MKRGNRLKDGHLADCVSHGSRKAASRAACGQFAVCVDNDGYEVSLERNKIYVVLPDKDAERDGDLRVVDESGEDTVLRQPLRRDRGSRSGQSVAESFLVAPRHGPAGSGASCARAAPTPSCRRSSIEFPDPLHRSGVESGHSDGLVFDRRVSGQPGDVGVGFPERGARRFVAGSRRKSPSCAQVFSSNSSASASLSRQPDGQHCSGRHLWSAPFSGSLSSSRSRSGH